MQLKQRHNNVKTNIDASAPIKVGIASNAKMFRLLSDTMYTNKIGSLVREISCNAIDGHTQAGYPEKPFTIHIPNAIEPWFAVKDEGVGISPENIRTIYSIYGHSTKDQENDSIGAFGLGSKTPYAYTDQFVVISIFDGVKCTYVSVIGNDGLPVMHLQDERDTDEHAGVEVNVTVNNEDFDEFANAVKEQLKFFKVKPNLINNMRELEFASVDDTSEISIQNNLITMYKGSINSPVRGLWIIQGGVGYPLNIERLTGLDRNIRDFANELKNENGYMVFPIGQISVTASREDVSYEPETIAIISKRLGEVAASLTDEVIGLLKKEKSLWNRVEIFNNQISVIRTAIRQISDFETLFKGTNPVNGRLVISHDDLNKLGYNISYMEEKEYTTRGFDTKSRMIRKIVGNSPARYSSETQLESSFDIDIFIRDTNSKPIARIKHFLDENGIDEVLLIVSYDKVDITDSHINDVAKAIHVDPSRIVRLSTLKAPKKVYDGTGPANRTGEKRPRAFVYTKGKDDYNSKEWEGMYDDIDDFGEAIYMTMSRHTVQIDDNSKYHTFIRAVNAGHITKPVIAVNEQTAGRIAAGKIGSKLIKWEDTVDDILSGIEKVASIIKAHAKFDAYISTFKDEGLWEKMGDAGYTLPILKRIESVELRMLQLEDRMNGFKWANVNTNNEYQIGRKAALNQIRKISSLYPLLRHIGNYPNKRDVEDAIEYVKLVEGA